MQNNSTAKRFYDRVVAGRTRWNPATTPSSTSSYVNSERASADGAAKGASSCVVVLQLLFGMCMTIVPVAGYLEEGLGVIFLQYGTSQYEPLWTWHLFVPWILFNIMHWYTYRSDGGRVAAEDCTQDPPPVNPNSPGAADPIPEDVWLVHPSTGERWCRTCGHWAPIRSRHCIQCGHCTAKWDHHCFWIGTDVGVANHRRFLTMLYVDCWFLFEASITLFELLSWDFHTMPKMVRSVTILILFIVALALLALVLALGAFHTFLAATGVTTWELMSPEKITYLRARVISNSKRTDCNGVCVDSPFNRGIVQNLVEFWWTRPKRWVLSDKDRDPLLV